MEITPEIRTCDTHFVLRRISLFVKIVCNTDSRSCVLFRNALTGVGPVIDTNLWAIPVCTKIGVVRRKLEDLLRELKSRAQRSIPATEKRSGAKFI